MNLRLSALPGEPGGDRDETTGNFGLAGSGLERRRYAQQDANFNVVSISDQDGAVQQRHVYQAYGAVSTFEADWTYDPRSGGANDWLYLFQGGRYDFTTRLYHFRHRDYDAVLGRWNQQDPMGYVDGGSLYQAMLSDPVSERDPMGLEALPPGWSGTLPGQWLPYTPPSPPTKSTSDHLRDALSSAQRQCPACQTQAAELAAAIDKAVEDESWQPGGYLGNCFTKFGANDCDMWQTLVGDAIEPLLRRYGNQSCFVAIKSGSYTGSEPNTGTTHQWVTIVGGGGSVPIDPWLSGGSRVVDPTITGRGKQTASPMNYPGLRGNNPCDCRNGGGSSGSPNQPRKPGSPRSLESVVVPPTTRQH